MSAGFTFLIVPIAPEDDGGTGQRWMAEVNIGGSPAYDGGGATIEEALAALVSQMAQAIMDGVA